MIRRILFKPLDHEVMISKSEACCNAALPVCVMAETSTVCPIDETLCFGTALSGIVAVQGPYLDMQF
jgi:hypothetical protein